MGSSYFRLLVTKGAGTGSAYGPAGRSAESGKIMHADLYGAGPDSSTSAGSFAEDRRYVGWGEELDRECEIGGDAIRAARAALGELVCRARDLGCEEPLVAGTNTLREARNSSVVTEILAESVSLPITVLSERGEASLGFSGACSGLVDPGPVLLLDPGGTSTEVAWGSDGVFEGSISVPCGTHRVAHIVGREAPFSGAWRRLRERLVSRFRSELGEGLARRYGDSHLSRDFEKINILATGGTAVSLAVCLRFMCDRTASFVELERMSREDVDFLARRLLSLYRTGRDRALPLDGSRRKLLLPGLILFEALLKALAISSFRVTSRDLRWGIVLSGGLFTEDEKFFRG